MCARVTASSTSALRVFSSAMRSVAVSLLQRRGHRVERRGRADRARCLQPSTGHARAELPRRELPGGRDQRVDPAEDELPPDIAAITARIVTRPSPARLRTRRRLMSANANALGVPIVACRSWPAISGACAHSRLTPCASSASKTPPSLWSDTIVEDPRFGQRLADPVARIGHAREHRSIAIGHHQHGAWRKCDVRERRREPIQALHDDRQRLRALPRSPAAGRHS